MSDGSIRISPAEIAALAPRLARLGEEMARLAQGLDGVAATAAAAAGHADLSNGLHELGDRWSALLATVASQLGDTGAHIARSAEAFASTDEAVRQAAAGGAS